MKTRNGKIARLPREVREAVNQYLRNGGPTKRLLDELNMSVGVIEILATEFGGEPITRQNLSAWRQGGYREWLVRQEVLQDARDASEHSRELDQEGGARLADRLMQVLVGRHASVLMQLDGKPDRKLQAELRSLGQLNRDVTLLQRGVQRAAQVRIAEERHEREGLRFVQEMKGWISQGRAEQEVVPPMMEMMKEIMGKLGFDYEQLKRKAEREKAKVETRLRKASARQARQANPHPGPLPSDGRGGTIGQAPAMEPIKETLNPEPGTLNVEQAEGKEEQRMPNGTEPKMAEKSKSEVVERESGARAVKVNQGNVKSEAGNQKSEYSGEGEERWN